MPLLKKILILFAAFFILVSAGLTLFIFSIKNGSFGELPDHNQLKQIENHVASEVYSADSVLLGKYYLVNRTNTSWQQISPNIVNALIATEDIRFFDHQGIDKRSLFRVLVKSLILQNESSGGGSTISQQLAKNLYPRERHNYLSLTINKIKEVFIAVSLEEIYSKEEILTLYLNTVSFGENVFGIEVACERYFSTTPKNINLNEAAVLIGMLKATSSYNPRTNAEKALHRRNIVLNQMLKYNFLEKEIVDSLKQQTLNLRYKNITHNDGLAPYFRESLRLEIQKWLKENPKQDGSVYNLYTDGLKIFTTINSKMQKHGEKAVNTHLKELQKAFFSTLNVKKQSAQNESEVKAKFRSSRYKELKSKNLSEEKINAIFEKPIPMKVFSWNGELDTQMSPMDSIRYYRNFFNAGFFAMEPQTGKVLAWVGGIDYNYFKYDHIRSKRQVGSIFKPIVYAAAIEHGIDPCHYISNEREIYKEFANWSPENSNSEYEGYYTLQGALTKSLNTISTKIIMQTGTKPVINMAQRMGITSELPAVPSLALGTADISLEEIVSAYTSFANGGERTQAVYIERIETSSGEIIKDFSSDFPLKNKAMEAETADIITHFLKCVVDSGTAISLRYKYGFKNEMAGKTGTTQNQVDGWYVGYTPDIVAGVWVGHDDPSVHFKNSQLGQGSKMALPIWANFMNNVYGDKDFKHKKKLTFPPLPEETALKLNCPPFVKKNPYNNNIWDLIIGKKRDKRIKPTIKNAHPKKKRFMENIKKVFN
ncbi:MAG: transglycosylase domain-containing protein [Bacteroidetes bacterium]|nr:transglycosylase domain-containing protein [Bacteroidota bacterium]HET6243960.1 transglycosylase domain-containing protein [Bacteroidia bacterium]